jgi:hypothetical protein
MRVAQGLLTCMIDARRPLRLGGYAGEKPQGYEGMIVGRDIQNRHGRSEGQERQNMEIMERGSFITR